MSVFVLDKHKKPLMPCTEKRARLLLTRKHAVVHRMVPFTIRLKNRTVENSKIQPLRIKLDPGSKTTGMAILREELEGKKGNQATVIWLGELNHKSGIKDRIDTRRAVRRNRRFRKTRYRKPRFLNRKRQKGWLAPSLEARVLQILNSITKLRNFLPISTISVENAKFDAQLLQNPKIQSVEYQQGTLFGYEVKEYLLVKYNWKCTYCKGFSNDSVLEVEHVIPKNPKNGTKGTDRISNLVITCQICNKDKGNLQPDIWLEQIQQSKHKIDQIRVKNLPEVMKQLKKPLRDTGIMNATRWKLYQSLQKIGLPLESGTGAQTKMQRKIHDLPKTHYYDAVCVGASTPKQLTITAKYVQCWSAVGRGQRQMARVDRHGFPIAHRKNQKKYYGFQTGDLVIADVPKGKYQGLWAGRVAIRAIGSFDVKNGSGKRICQGISYKYMKVLQRADGWHYTQQKI